MCFKFVFIYAYSQGFCLPAEFSDELGGEGATDFQDIEEGGIGEGEGMKDVSDQIDNEDQVRRKILSLVDCFGRVHTF